GLILANALTATSNGSPSLGRGDRVSNCNAMSTTGDVVLNNTGALNVTGISAGGALNLTNAGTLTVAATPTQDVMVSSNNGQMIKAGSLAVTSQNGHSAQIVNNLSGDQTIAIAGGPITSGIDVQALPGGFFASINNNALGGVQTIAVTNGDHLNVKGLGRF